MPKISNRGFALLDLQRELCDDIKDTLKDVVLCKPNGEDTRITVYPQQLPSPTSSDEDDELSRAPYVIARITNGERDKDNPFVVNAYLLMCIYNNLPDRSGHCELLNIISRLESRYSGRSYVGNFEVNPTFEFALQDTDTHPYYYGAVSLSFNAPKTAKEDPFT